MALPTVTVTGSRGGASAPSSSVTPAPGSTASRGDPHRVSKEEKRGLQNAALEAKRKREGGEPGAAPDTTGAAPDAPPQEELPTVTVVSTYPTIDDLDPNNDFHLSSPTNDTVITGKSFPSVQQTPLAQPWPRALSKAPSGQKFVGPSPVPLPEVVVEAQRPPARSAPRLLPQPAAFGGLNPYLLGLGFLLKQTSANIGEDKRVRKLIEKDLAARLLPVTTSVSRLPEPIASVTVRSSRISDRPAARAPSAVPRSPLGSPLLRSFPTPFVPKPTSVLKPTPQKRNKPVIEPTVLGFQPFPVSIPTPERINDPSLRPGRKPQNPILPLAPTVPSSPGLPTLGPQLPSPEPIPLVQPLTQFQGQCTCPQTQTKTQRRHRRKVRTKCYRGTFIEKSDRVNKTRLEEVPCTQDLRKSRKKRGPRKPAPYDTKTGKPYTPGLPRTKPKAKRK